MHNTEINNTCYISFTSILMEDTWNSKVNFANFTPLPQNVSRPIREMLRHD